jgi:hypothetical protein
VVACAVVTLVCFDRERTQKLQHGSQRQAVRSHSNKADAWEP